MPNAENLLDGAAGLERDARGRFGSSRAEQGRKRALEILESEDYIKSLNKRVAAGELAPVLEVWIWRIAYGDPPKPKEDTGEDEARFDRLRAKLKAFMKENPDEARTLGGMMARASLPAAIAETRESSTE